MCLHLKIIGYYDRNELLWNDRMVMLSHRGFLAKSLSNQEESTIQKEDAEGLDKGWLQYNLFSCNSIFIIRRL